MCTEGKIRVESLVVDAVCSRGCQACAEETRARWARRQAIMDAQGRMFDDTARPSSATPAPAVEHRAAA